MAIRSLDNEKDIQDVNDALSGNSKGFIKLGQKTYIRLLSKDYVSEFVHFVNKKAVVCLGDYKKDKGYSPKVCPVCAKVEVLWEEYNKIKEKNSKTQKSDLKVVLDKINAIQSKHQTVMSAIAGSVKNEEDEEGNLKSFVDWDKEAKILKISPAQWVKLTQKVFEDFDFMKTHDDLINRNLIFQKESKTGKTDDNQYTEVDIKPSPKKSKAPEITNELPVLEENFNYLSKKETLNLLSDPDQEKEEIDEDLEVEVEVEEKKVTKKTQPGKKTQVAKKLEEEDEEDEPDFVTDDFEDEDVSEDDSDYDFEDE